MNCTNCGTPLSSDALACPHCGTLTPAYYTNSGSSAYNPTVAAQPYPPPAPSQSTSYGADPYSTPPPPMYNSGPTIPAQNQYDPYHAQNPPPPVYTPAPQFSPTLPPPQKRTNRMPIIIGIVILIVVLVGGGLIALLSHALSSGSSKTDTTPTATSATAKNPYASGGTLVLDDPMHDNSKGYKWDEQTMNDSGATDVCAFSGGAYHVSIKQTTSTDNKGLACNPEAPQLVFSNLAFEANVTILQGSDAGIAFRVDQPSSKAYLFSVDTSGNYFMTKFNADKPLRTGSNAVIKKGLNQANLVAAVANGQTLTLYVNGQYVDSLQDNSFTQGQIGVYGGGTGNVDVAISNVRAWKL